MLHALRKHANGRSPQPSREVCSELGAGDTPDPVGPEETRHGEVMLLREAGGGASGPARASRA
jgi:hypothetical protein